MRHDKAEGQRQTAVSHRSSRYDWPAAMASKPSSRSWWFLIGVIGLLLVLATVTRVFSSDRRSLAVSDYVPIVTTGPGRKDRPIIYNYQASSKPMPSTGNGVAPVSDIDDRSSEAAYQRSCLAALTREKNPEIMALSQAVREDMCTDPRRR